MQDSKLELLRNSIMDTIGVEEKVEVNQRHLIDKILARYSAEYVLYRELMQNADDALSTSVQIHFQTNSPDQTKLPNFSTKCHRIVFKNNGMPFRPEDWQRLKRIAEGNPDEQKIGAFGVGFYSLFSVCENPFVSSGTQCMTFYFKGDQLFAKRAVVPGEDVDVWTSFLMDLREPMEMPDFDHFFQFLTTSMGFTANLKEITVFFDEKKIFHIMKRVAEPRSISIDSSTMLLTTPQRMFTIVGSDMQQIQLDSEKYTPLNLLSPITDFLTGKGSSSEDREKNENGLPVKKNSIFLKVVTASLKVNVSHDYEKEMERATKKKPPKTTRFQLVYTGKEELDASENNDQIFKDLIPFPNQGRVFIGFPTHQTTGCCCHMASRFIPTVERESIDFADRYISIWNKELLVVGGLLARLVYNDEMKQISRLYRELVGYTTEVDKTIVEDESGAKLMLEKRAAHALRSFTFQRSTPSPIVGQVQEERFFSSCNAPINVISSHGIQPITIVRAIPDSDRGAGHVITSLLDKFIKTVPTVTQATLNECRVSLTKLTELKLLSPLGIFDVLKELDARSLKEEEMVACMKYWVECNKKNPSIPTTTLALVNQKRSQFLDAAILDRGEDKPLLQLAHARWWLNPKVIPSDMDIPDDTIPFSVSKNFSPNDLASYFGDMRELSIYHWLQYIASTKSELETSKHFAERILVIVSRQYTHVSSEAQGQIISLLRVKKCVPTKLGMKLPHEAYFPSVNLFDDLPVYDFSKNINESFLTALGIRKHVELQMVFDRLISDGSWSHVELVKYLTSVQSTLSSTEIRRLRETAIFTKEGEEPKLREIEKPTGNLAEDGNPIMEKQARKVYKRYRACDLFSPTDIARDLNLPIIYWSSAPRWKATSDEAKFLEKLGLATSPPLSTLLLLAASDGNQSSNTKKSQQHALAYLIEHHQEYKSVYDVNKIQIKFLPCSDGKTYAAPRDCFTNPDVQLLGFQVIHSELIAVRDKLGVRENPTADRLVEAFLNIRELNRDKARKIFEYMASRMGEFSNSNWQQLRQAPFIPVQQDGAIQLKEPSQCYFETEDSSSFHKELFLYVSFGSLANSFLRSCGVKDEPTTVELAAMIVKDPQRFWELSSGGERYLGVLRQIAGQFYLIKSNRQLYNDMKTKPFLVGIKRTTLSEQQQMQSKNEDFTQDNEGTNDEEFIQYRLAKASDIFIVDDTMGQQIFSPLTAPMETLLEDFYSNLGSKMLSTQIREAYSYASNVGNTSRTKEIADMIFERTPIIIYQMMNDNPQRRKELLHDERFVKQHLKVTQVKDLKITRTFKHTGENNIQPTTSCADRINFGIYISDSRDIDYYDIANSLCTLIFARVRFNDAIIAERYLTASLQNLRRKGVPVDRILNIRKQQQHQSTPSSISSVPGSSSPSPVDLPKPLSPRELNAYTKQVKEVFGDCQEGYIRQLLAQQHENHVNNVINKLLNENYPKTQQSGEKEIINSVISEDEEKKKKELELLKQQQQLQIKQEKSSGFINRLWSNWKQPVPTTSLPPPQKPISTPSMTEIDNQIKSSAQKPKLPNSDTTITPNFTTNIRQNLKRAIYSCKPYVGQDVYTPPRINQVNESRNYCDATPGQDLTYVGKITGMEFYVHRNVQPNDVLEQYGQAMKRFNSILTELATKVFQLQLECIHLFYDTEGPTIAFNLSGSLFMNFRYYLALHEATKKEEETSKRKEALIYWFMTLCHEIAHNFVSEHNSEHEFYLSAFAENLLGSLMDHIYSSSNTNTAAIEPSKPPLTLLD